MKDYNKIFFLLLTLVAVFLFFIPGCTENKESKRIAELHAKKALWESTILPASPQAPDLDTLLPMNDSRDPGMIEKFTEEQFGPDYIPDIVYAITEDTAKSKGPEFRGTIAIGDVVEVLEEGRTISKAKVFLVRTSSGTYAWLYPFHLEDENGNRMGSL